MSSEKTNVSYTGEIELSVVVCSDYGSPPLSLLNHMDNLIFVTSTLPWTWIHRLHVSQLIRLRIPEQGPMICCGTYIQWDLPWRDIGTIIGTHADSQKAQIHRTRNTINSIQPKASVRIWEPEKNVLVYFFFLSFVIVFLRLTGLDTFYKIFPFCNISNFRTLRNTINLVNISVISDCSFNMGGFYRTFFNDLNSAGKSVIFTIIFWWIITDSSKEIRVTLRLY